MNLTTTQKKTDLYIGYRAIKTPQFKCCIGHLENIWSAVWIWIENIAYKAAKRLG